MTCDFLFYRVRERMVAAGFTIAAETIDRRWEDYSLPMRRGIAHIWDHHTTRQPNQITQGGEGE